MEKVCIICGTKILKNGQKYCSYECAKLANRRRFKEVNPDTLRGKTSATTGAISELRVAIDLLAKGYDVFRALSPNCPCDLAILKDHKLLRIEVRTTHISTSGKMYRTISQTDDKGNIDIYARVLPDKIIYEPELD